MPNHPYGITPPLLEVARAVDKTQEVYKPLPETTCDHRAICCKAGCPNMYYAEFYSIYSNYVMKMPREKRIELTLQCIRQYLQPQSVEKTKPCVHLSSDNKCTVYSSRPLKCRLYGLIPPALYNKIVSAVAEDMQVEKEKLPLCQQCDRVKIKPEFADKFPSGKIPQPMIKEMEQALKDNDLRLGIPKSVQDDGFGYLTYHDWHVMFELGEKVMEVLTKSRLTFSEDKKEQLVVALKKLLDGVSESEQGCA